MNYQTIDFINSLYLSHCILHKCKFIYFNFDQVLDIGTKFKKKTCMKVFFLYTSFDTPWNRCWDILFWFSLYCLWAFKIYLTSSIGNNISQCYISTCLQDICIKIVKIWSSLIQFFETRAGKTSSSSHHSREQLDISM